MIKYSDIIMKFESESGDACSHYTASLKGNHTLQELVDYALSNKEEWGNIELHQDGKEIARIEFSHGSLKNEVDAAYLNKEIELTRMDGGWSYMSYSCNLKGDIKEETEGDQKESTITNLVLSGLEETMNQIDAKLQDILGKPDEMCCPIEVNVIIELGLGINGGTVRPPFVPCKTYVEALKIVEVDQLGEVRCLLLYQGEGKENSQIIVTDSSEDIYAKIGVAVTKFNVLKNVSKIKAGKEV